MMSDLQLLRNQIEGIQVKIQNLRAAERLFLKASGLDEEIEKAKKEVGDLEVDIQAAKEEYAEFISRKNEVVSKTVKGLSRKMFQVIPQGSEPVIEITEDGSLDMRWSKTGKCPTPHAGLSGGEKTSFDCALAYGLGCECVIQEAAELDKPSLFLSLNRFGSMENGMQVIVNTCHEPDNIPSGWEVIRL